MKLLSYSINIDEFQDGKQSPVMKYSGVYPSEAFKTPRDLLQSIVEFLNEEFDLDMTIVSQLKITKVDTESSVTDLDTVKARQERLAKNKRELGYE